MGFRGHHEYTRWPARGVDTAAPALAEIGRATRPGASTAAWPTRGLCRDLDPDLHFPDDELDESDRLQQVAAAKSACFACPVMEQCRAHALQAGEPHGVWGGTTPEERRLLLDRERRLRRATARTSRPDTATA